MPNVTSVEDSMKRLLRLCPNITLDTRAIQLIVDGKMNQVMSEFRTGKQVVEDVIADYTTSTTESSTVSINESPEIIYTQEVTEDIKTEEKPFGDYFKKKSKKSKSKRD